MQSLPGPVAAMAWGYVGADLSGLFRAYDVHAQNKEKFLREEMKKHNWQHLLEQCATFYAPGYDWIILVIAPQHIDRVDALCHAIRSNNLGFAMWRWHISEGKKT